MHSFVQSADLLSKRRLTVSISCPIVCSTIEYCLKIKYQLPDFKLTFTDITFTYKASTITALFFNDINYICINK